MAVLLTSCSTQKADWTHVTYHNTTAHYNVWWNGNESLKKGVENMNKQLRDDYTRLLPVYKTGTKEQCMAYKSDFDRAIEKGIKGIKKHSIFIDGQEHVAYIPKCYLLTAYASFYEHDFATAANTCQVLAAQYAGTAVGDEASVLLARCSTMQQRYNDAETALDVLVANDGKGSFDKGQRLGLYMAMAECTLPQEKYKKGVNFLKQALEQKPPQQVKARICFILGQVYQQLDKRPTASKYYAKVLDCSPDFEMEFNARLNLASCADIQHTDAAKLERLLDNMLKEKKYEEFQDQIYYAKGEMYIGMQDYKTACQYLRKSAGISKGNPSQKARSSIRLGEILYVNYQDYDNAQRYYDTAMAIIKPDYPRYAHIRSRHELLTSLTSYSRVVSRNDSLIAVADMPEAKRAELIAKKIEEVKRAEEEAKKQALLEELANDAKAQTNTLQGDWYFYNSNTVQNGKNTFRQRWGQRTLEDYWFLGNKGMLSVGLLAMGDVPEDSADSTGMDSTQVAADSLQMTQKGGNPDDPHDVAYYLKDLPKSQAERDSMQQQTAVCLLNAGYIYYDGVNNTPKAMECYLRMTEQYTENPEIVQAFFMLYKVYDKQGNTPSSNYYRNMVLMGFPDSDFANMILDEEYYKEIIHRGQLVREDYEEVYNLYRRHRYDEVISKVSTAKELYAQDPMLGKFRYWEGLANVRLGDKQQAIGVFRDILAHYPETDSIYPLALAQLESLTGDDAPLAEAHEDEKIDDPADAGSVQPGKKAPGRNEVQADAIELSPEAQLFRYRENMPHFVIILIKDKKIRATDLQVKVGDFNMTYYANSGLKVSPLMFTDTSQMITVTSFNDAVTAMDYYRHLLRPESPLSQYQSADFQLFAISKQNYTTFYNRKRIDAYQSFFEKYYLSK